MAKPFDYSQFKTPYYELEIAPGPKGPFVKMPYQISRLISKVEIMQASGTPDTCMQTTINIVFATGSREPFQTLNTSPAGLYDTGTGNTNDAFTNAVSMLTDLRFSFEGGSVGLTSLISEGVAAISGLAEEGLATLTGQSADKITTTKQKATKTNSYLFKEGNAVRLTWGYKELQKEKNVTMAVIRMVQVDYPENDMPMLTITCQTAFANGEKIAPMKAQTYWKKIPGGFDPTAGVTYKFKAMSTQEVVKKICDDAGMDLIISPQLTASRSEEDTHITWPAGMTLIEFLSDLAGRHNAVLDMRYNAKNGKPTVAFVSRTDFYGTTILPQEFFHFKRNGSLLKSVNIRADFGAQTGAGLLGMDTKGQVVGHAAEVPETIHLTNAKDGYIVDTNTVKKEAEFKQLSDKVSNGTVVHKAGYTPEVKKSDNLKNNTSSAAACAVHKNLINIEMTSIGHPLLRPGSIRLNGIGRRYSGIYRILTITHVLDSSGYICRMTGTGNLMGEGGVQDPGTTINEPDTKEAIQLADPQQLSAAIGAAADILGSDIEPPFSGTNSAIFKKYSDLVVG